MTPEQLDCIAEHLIAKALGNNPHAIAEAHRRIEAGETVTNRGLHAGSGAVAGEISPLVILEKGWVCSPSIAHSLHVDTVRKTG
jgi:hypothetical protein